jgi:hypothetical protein
MSDGVSVCVPGEEAGGLEEARSGGRGRKLQAVEDRVETRVKISVMSRCWTEVSCPGQLCGSGVRGCRNGGKRSHELRVELGQAGLAGVVENQDGVNHVCCSENVELDK